MTPAPTRDEIEELAARDEQETITVLSKINGLALTDREKSMTAESWRREAAEYQLRAQALRLLAASIGAEPVAYRFRLSPRDELWSYWEHPPSRPEFPRAIIEPLYATPQPSPDYAKGKWDGLDAEKNKRLQDAIEGECDGLAIDDVTAGVILDYVGGDDDPDREAIARALKEATNAGNTPRA